MQGSGSAALIPVPPRNCRHSGTCLKYMSSPTYHTGVPQSIPLEQSQQLQFNRHWHPLVLWLGSRSSRSVTQAVMHPCLMYLALFLPL